MPDIEKSDQYKKQAKEEISNYSSLDDILFDLEIMLAAQPSVKGSSHISEDEWLFQMALRSNKSLVCQVFYKWDGNLEDVKIEFVGIRIKEGKLET